MMERLTNENHKEMGLVAYTGEKNPYNVPLTIGELAGFITSDYSPREILEEVFARLAAYEDTGLEPEEIDSVFINSVIEENKRFKELAQAEKDGQLVVLPCKPDESVYQWKKGDDIPSLFRFDGVNINEDGEVAYQTHWGETFTLDDFGKTVFLTREEAEAALKKREE